MSPAADGNGPGHEHPPWTATSRGIETSLQTAGHAGAGLRAWFPDLLRSGRVNRQAEQRRWR